MIFGIDLVPAGYDPVEVSKSARERLERKLNEAAATIRPGVDVQHYVLEGSAVDALRAPRRTASTCWWSDRGSTARCAGCCSAGSRRGSCARARCPCSRSRAPRADPRLSNPAPRRARPAPARRKARKRLGTSYRCSWNGGRPRVRGEPSNEWTFVPYLHCPSCRLTIYKPRDLVRAPQRCPRCDAWLSRRPARLFRTLPATPMVTEKGTRPSAGTRIVRPPAVR